MRIECGAFATALPEQLCGMLQAMPGSMTFFYKGRSYGSDEIPALCEAVAQTQNELRREIRRARLGKVAIILCGTGSILGVISALIEIAIVK